MQIKSSVLVIGAGFVGSSLGTVFAEKGLDVWSWDISGKVANGCRDPRSLTSSRFLALTTSDVVRLIQHHDPGFSGIAFACVPTPMFEDGEADLSIVESVLDELSKASEPVIAVVKSTVPPGSTEFWNTKFEGTGLTVCFSPEHLREASSLEDQRNQDRIVIGGPRPQVDQVRDIFRMAFPEVPIIKTSSVNAELTKYVINTFLASKVSYANEIYQLCEALAARGDDVDYDRVIEIATLDKRLGTSHWKVPGPMPSDDDKHELRRGWSGSCFAKDVNALLYLMKDLGVNPQMLQAAWDKNLEVRPERDWEKLIGRAVSKKKDAA